ncbi:hypothetical protein PAXRUDRAFT_312570 [Paxillus rubicundulus Ve08.2h10]|uniref:Zn(2)-C6 fungal-type domain-containing protein n=1 Tax=Paxillus rubicundulus Ve08.2h10 TaxID=930991 RepID=A0A0D0DKG8_9AGAM|nr:hypothetical protein PAXRUDRAFT_312570 [Paxillus rubicundulus Ve08.2h10]
MPDVCLTTDARFPITDASRGSVSTARTSPWLLSFSQSRAATLPLANAPSISMVDQPQTQYVDTNSLGVIYPSPTMSSSPHYPSSYPSYPSHGPLHHSYSSSSLPQFPPPQLAQPTVAVSSAPPETGLPRCALAGSLDPTTGIFYRTPDHPRMRTAQACEKCRVRKAKCSGDRPACQRCQTRGLVCHYTPENRVRGPNKPKVKAKSTEPGSDGERSTSGSASKSGSASPVMESSPPASSDSEHSRTADAKGSRRAERKAPVSAVRNRPSNLDTNTQGQDAFSFESIVTPTLLKNLSAAGDAFPSVNPVDHIPAYINTSTSAAFTLTKPAMLQYPESGEYQMAVNHHILPRRASSCSDTASALDLTPQAAYEISPFEFVDQEGHTTTRKSLEINTDFTNVHLPGIEPMTLTDVSECNERGSTYGGGKGPLTLSPSPSASAVVTRANSTGPPTTPENYLSSPFGMSYLPLMSSPLNQLNNGGYGFEYSPGHAGVDAPYNYPLGDAGTAGTDVGGLFDAFGQYMEEQGVKEDREGGFCSGMEHSMESVF